MYDQSITSKTKRASDPSIQVLSPFMSGNSGKCIFAVCDEADTAELSNAVSDYLYLAASNHVSGD